MPAASVFEAPMQWLYEILFTLGYLAYIPGALLRKRLPHAGWTMRLGRYPQAILENLRGSKNIWVHAVSVGEVLSSRPLLNALADRKPQDKRIVSSITPGGFSLAERYVQKQGVAIYWPFDLTVCTERALAALRPRLLILMESELWPTMIRQARIRGVPVVVVNGRMSERTFRRYRRFRSLFNGMASSINQFLMQSKLDADRLTGLGVDPRKVIVTGNMKWDASAAAKPSPQEVQARKAQLGLSDAIPLVVAGSTHRGEEEAVLDAWQALQNKARPVRLIVAPRHLERLEEVERLILRRGAGCARLSSLAPNQPWQIGLVDTFGQLPCYYALAGVVFIGGSLIPHGGQNPVEASSQAKPVVFGPHMHNFSDIARQLLERQACIQVPDKNALSGALRGLLEDKARAKAMGERAERLTEESCGATRKTVDALEPYLA